MEEILIHKIDKNNFFYENIVTLAYTQFGINELFSRGFFADAVRRYPDYNARAGYFNSLGFPASVVDQLLRTRTFTPKIFIPGFTTKNGSNVFRMDVEASAAHFLHDTKGLTDKNIELTHMTIIVAWEKVLGLELADGPIFQFFRHIRNAAAHNGKFHFSKQVIDSNGELLKPAMWGNFEIKAAMQGKPLIVRTKKDESGFWDQGDLVEFLLDFETHYPEIKKTRSTESYLP